MTGEISFDPAIFRQRINDCAAVDVLGMLADDVQAMPDGEIKASLMADIKRRDAELAKPGLMRACSVVALAGGEVAGFALLVRDEARHDTRRGFVGGYELETLSLGLPFMAAFLNPGDWGRDFSAAMDAYDNMAGMWLVGEDMPQESNRITLHATEKDQFGLPIPNVHFSDHPNDIAMRNHGFKQGGALYESVGAKRVINTPPYPSTHNLGTNRMSEKPEDGVVNKWGQSHDIKNLFVSDGSQFTSGASENPTLTIVALAIRQAEYIERGLRKGAF